MQSELDQAFLGSMPAIYDRCLGPVLFEPYAAELAERLKNLKTGCVLELAAGTGILTRALSKLLPEGVSIVATDLNPAMLDYAASRLEDTRAVWQAADAQCLAFEDHTFDVVACQFGVMFFPNKVAVYSETRRVLKPRGRFVFNVMDRIEENELSHVMYETLRGLFSEDPPSFAVRTPHAYYDVNTIRIELEQAGFRCRTIETLQRRTTGALSPRDIAVGFCQGTPMRYEIEARDAARLGEATDAVARAIARRFGQSPTQAKMQAHVVVASL
jgi:ubiquinone/menaquinone biosynthesis C-methylase UbiE